MRIQSFYLLCIFLLPNWLSARGIDVSVEAQISLGQNLNLTQAQVLALKKARRLAIEKAVGIEVNSTSLLINDLLRASLMTTHSHGFLTKEQVQWETDIIKSAGKNNSVVVRANLQATVVPTAKTFLKPYHLSASIVQGYNLRVGESVQLRINPQRDMYLLIANFSGKGEVNVLFPNQWHKDNKLIAKRSWEFPPKHSKPKLMIIEPKDDISQEAFIIIGLPITQETSKIDWINIWPKDKFPYTEFYQRLLDLNLAWMSEKILNYQIVQHSAEK